MIFKNRTIYSQILIFLIIFMNPFLKSQPNIHLPDEINLIVNGSILPQTPVWIDSLVDDALAGKIYYKIIGASGKGSTVITQVQLPQILSLDKVFRQIILYYGILPDEESREKERLHIFPYFEAITGEPALKCQYTSKGIYHIDVENWDQVPVPPQPIVEYRDIYNQILQISFQEIQSIGDVSEHVFEKVAIKNKLSVKQIKEIYQNTILWQLGSQIYPE